MPYSYEDYNEKSKTYTSLRCAIGCEEMLREFRTIGDLKQMKLLDAGCGTGNYTLAFAPAFQSVHCTDYNEAMLAECQNNLIKHNHATADTIGFKAIENVEFSQGSITDLFGFNASSFNAICCNQVVHHLRPDDDFLDWRTALDHFNRVLQDGGKLSVNWLPAEIAKNAAYFNELIPIAFEKWLSTTPTSAKMHECLEAAGFTNIRMEPNIQQILYSPELYFDPRNMIDIHRYKLCDSTFALCTPEELEAAKARVEKMNRDGTLDAWFQTKEDQRLQTGQTVTVFADKK